MRVPYFFFFFFFFNKNIFKKYEIIIVNSNSHWSLISAEISSVIARVKGELMNFRIENGKSLPKGVEHES